jgi:hypothetical protein
MCVTGMWTAILYGFDTWSVTLREWHRLRKLKGRFLRAIFGYKWDGVNRKLENTA